MDPYQEYDIVKQSASTKDLKRRFWLKVIGAAFMVFFLGGGLAVVTTYVALKSAAEDGTQLAQQIKQKCEEPGLTDPDLEQFCPVADEVVEAAPEQVKSDPVPGPPGPSGATGDAGTNGTNGSDGADAPAPTATQVRNAVESLCQDAPRICRSNRSLTATQVAVALEAYCDANGKCLGPRGGVGPAGDDGADGENAPAPTVSQIAAGVELYCSSRNECRGTDGAPGQDGQNGSDSTVPGPPGVIAIQDDCPPAPDGRVVDDIIPSYNSATQTIVISCTYKDDLQGGLLPTNP